jgi:DNA-binding NarL/FixJ family response regulator
MHEAFPHVSLAPFFNCDQMLAYLLDETQSLPDFIFLDMNMPGNEGHACLQTIKKTARLLHIPVIIYSTSDYHKEIEQALFYGAYKYIVKPGSFTEIKNTFHELFAAYEGTDN